MPTEPTTHSMLTTYDSKSDDDDSHDKTNINLVGKSVGYVYVASTRVDRMNTTLGHQSLYSSRETSRLCYGQQKSGIL